MPQVPQVPPVPPPPAERPPRPERPDQGEFDPPLATWSPLEAVPVLVMALVLAFLADAVVMAVIPGCASAFVVASFLGELAFAVAVLVWVRFVNRGPLAALGAPRHPLGDIGTGFAGGLLLTVAGLAAAAIVLAVGRAILGHQPAQPQQIETCVGGAWLPLSGIVVILAAPFGEELFFRGFLYKGLRRRYPPWKAALISGAAFSLIHVQPILVLALFPVGVGLAMVYERRQSVLASMVAHATFNVIGFLSIIHAR